MDCESQESWQSSSTDIGRLIQASVLGKTALNAQIRRLMKSQTVLLHDSGLQISICDLTYELLIINQAKKTWLERSCFSVVGQELIVFGVAEEWNSASKYPSGQLVFMITTKWDVFVYHGGLLFYLAPTMSDFWHCAIVMEYWNAVFPRPLYVHVKPHCRSVDELIKMYHVFELERQVLLARKDKCEKTGKKTYAKSVNGIIRSIVESYKNIESGKIPCLFVERSALYANANVLFFRYYLRSKGRLEENETAESESERRVDEVPTEAFQTPLTDSKVLTNSTEHAEKVCAHDIC
ncbi:protein UL38 [Saimiriine betaherpesvirus 4]|uniref:Protein UL38 n=1 Tax=Saimiriine betaherpesvirus 4 TaxID=1535247 RepID=G8XSV2_9BETA|nr:protein UL38 [Saimiriine betaherpesvirus 4]AEV80899.1 protein UL38 [Saimiriine betaherpesvirus 4]